MEKSSFEFTPIGYFSSSLKHRFETPRQGAYADNAGVIVLNDDPQLIEACRDLDGVERIWVIFVFHLNQHWRSCVAPPVSPGRRIGTFATRAPYRPNPVGISCVEVEKVEKNRIFIRNYDLLDGTPVLDIKPYIPAVDAFPDSGVKWLEEAQAESYRLIFPAPVRERMMWVKENGGPDLENFCKVQLSIDPFNHRRKRVRRTGNKEIWEIGCRTWKISFRQQEQVLEISSVASNYRPDELLPESPDPYGDKELHRLWADRFCDN